MRSNQLVWMGAALLAASAVGMGCSSHRSTSGSLNVTASALSYTDIDHVTVDISGTQIVPTKHVPMGLKNNSNDWNAVVAGIPAGAVTVTANAYKAGSNTPVFSGQINTTITVGGTAVINITMSEVSPSKYSNSAPVISAIQVTAKTVAPLASIGVGVVAMDPDGDALTYAWTSSCAGSFSAAAAASGTFTAPATLGVCTLTVTVADTKQASTTATVQISVQTDSTGSANITATPDLAPTVAFVGISVKDSSGNDAPFVAGNKANLSVSASDDNTLTPLLTYAWLADCAGTFDSTTSASPVFTLSANTGTCTFTVTVTDAQGSSNSGTITHAVQAAAGIEAVYPTITLSSQSSTDAYVGGTLHFYVEYELQTGHSATVDWTASNGTGTAANDLTALTSSFAWTTPAGLTDGTAVTFTVKITDATNTLSVSKIFTATAASDQCTGKADGASCTGTNPCFQAYSCQNQVCVGANPIDCSVSVPTCKAAGACNPANGQCVYPNAANGAACSDGSLCTGTTSAPDHCNGAGTCVAGALVTCPPASDACHVAGTCNLQSGQCSAQTLAPSGTSCSSGNACMQSGACDANGNCVGSNPVTCPPATDSCHVAGACVPATGLCAAQTAAADGTTCNDNNLCTNNDKCTSGVCGGTAKCDPALDTCDPNVGTCVPISSGPAPLCMAPQYGADWNVASAAGLATDAGGNVFVSGTMYGIASAPIAFGSVNLGAGAGANVYAARLNPTTGATAWAKVWGDDSDQAGVGMAASSTNVAIIGNYIGVLGSGTTGTTTIAGLPANTASLPVDFVVGLDSATGNPTWGKKIDMGGVGMASIYSNPTLSAYYLCGSSAVATTDLGSGLVAGATDGSTDIVVAKINAADGVVAWARQIGGAGTQACTAVTADGTNVYLTGTYQGTLDFGNGVGAFPVVSNIARKLLWVAKLNDADGTALVAKTWGTTGAQLIRAITTDVSGNVLIAGAMATTMPFGGTVGTLTASGTDAFVAKFDSSLTPLWAHNWGDATTQDMRAIATDSAGNVFASGLFNGTVSAGGTTLTASGADILTMKLDTAGNVVCMAKYGDSAGDQSDALVVNRFASTASGQKDKCVFSGLIGGNVVFSSTITLSTPSLGTKYGYVVGINPNSL